LHLAARAGNLDTLKLLLQYGADPTISGPHGTPREVAFLANQQAAVDAFAAYETAVTEVSLALRRPVTTSLGWARRKSNVSDMTSDTVREASVAERLRPVRGIDRLRECLECWAGQSREVPKSHRARPRL